MLLRVVSVLIAGLLPLGAHAEVKGPATVIDGDTLEIDGQRVHLVDIDALELDQHCWPEADARPCGVAARAQLMDLTSAVEVACRDLEETTDGAVTATCYADGYDLSEGMVYTGWALALPHRKARYSRVQEETAAARRGMWRFGFQAPWDWRQWGPSDAAPYHQANSE